MKILVACKALEDEIKSALTRLKLDYPVVWVEGSLHSVLDKLRAYLQQVMDEADGQCDTLIFALGYCGGAMSELNTGNYTTVMFLSDDCLSVLLGSLEARMRYNRPATYFLTAGWLRYENNIVDSYKRTMEKYGQAKADRISKMMLAHYKRIGLVNTGCYDLTTVSDRVAQLAEKLELDVECLPGNSSWLEALLTGPWDDSSRFLVLPPKSQLRFDEWMGLLDQVQASTTR